MRWGPWASGGAIALLAATAPGHAAEQPVCAPPRCVEATVPVPAGLKVPDSRVRVLLPSDYHADPCRRWPVLYLLHGVGDTYTSWTRNADVVAFTADKPVIVVMPDAGKNPDAGWYSDWADGSRHWERFHVDVLVPWVESTFRTAGADHRLVTGFSMGGFGAMSYAARHPGLFDAAASISGFVDTMYGAPASGVGFELGSDYLGSPDARVWGDQVRDEATWRDHNPTDRAADLKGTALYLYSGMGAPAAPGEDDPTKTANHLVEHYVFHTNLSFTRALDAAGVPYEADFHAGNHDWPYFEAGLHWALPRMLATPAGASTSACAAAPAATEPTAVAAAELPATGRPPRSALGATLVAAALVLRRVRRRPA